MGVKISIDKHVSELEDILEMSPHYLSRVQFDSKISPDITQHLKIWRFYESKKNYDYVKSSPVPLHNMADNQFYFSSEEAYLILLIYKSGSESTSSLANFPHSLWGVVQSVENLTPRGLQNTFSSNEQQLNQHSLQSFLLSQRRDESGSEHNSSNKNKNNENSKGSQKNSKNGSNSGSSKDSSGQKYKYMLFVWNGKNSGASVKSQTLTKGYALDEYLQQAKDSGLNVLFSGGVVKNKKLQRGNIYIFEDVIDHQKMLKKSSKPKHEPNTEEMVQAYESVYLLKWLFPDTTIQKYRSKIQEINHGNYPKFHQQFLKSSNTGAAESASTTQQSYWDRFQILDDVDEIDTDAEDYIQDESEDDENMDYDMRNLGQGANRPDDYDEDMINDEIEDIESDDENAQIYAYQQIEREKQQKQKVSVPGLSLGGISSAGYGAVKPGEPGFAPPKAMGLNIGAIGQAQQKQQQNKGMSLNLPRQQEPNKQSKVPSLNFGGAAVIGSSGGESDYSGRTSSKRHGVASLNLNKAIAIQQQQIHKKELAIDQAKQKKIQDLDEDQQATAPRAGGSGMGLNLGSVEKQHPAAQLSLNIGQKPIQPPVESQGALNFQNLDRGRDNEDDGGGGNRRRTFNEQDAALEKLDEEFDYQGTSRKAYQNAMFNEVCSEIIPQFLYLGSDIVAQDYDKLKDNGITHVLNCAAAYSADYHEQKGIKYKSFYLKDHTRENIECCFYDVIDFFQSAKKEGGRIFVHCVQGISRSTTMCLAYMIFTNKTTLDDGLNFIRERRQIANPNMTFMAQLIWFYKRLYGNSIDSIPVNPRVFLVSSHQPEDPFRIACRLTMENLYMNNETSKKLDPRAIFIVQGPSNVPLYIWTGANVAPTNLPVYLAEAERYAKILQKNEKANEKIIYVDQGNEDNQFWSLFFKNQQKPNSSVLYGKVGEWNSHIIDLGQQQNFVKAEPAVVQTMQYKDEVQEEQKLKPKLYSYPNWNECSTVFDFEELIEDQLLVLCVRAQHTVPGHELDNHKVYIWRGNEFDDEEANNEVIGIQEFTNRVLEQYWGCKNPQDQFNIEIINEISQHESEDFYDYF